MAQITSYVYLIDFKDGSESVSMTKSELENSVDDMYNNISKIVKQYRLKDVIKKKFNLTLYLETDETISSNDYIEHYRNLSKTEYGVNFLSNFDIEIINMFN
jgi:hypothetical protein